MHGYGKQWNRKVGHNFTSHTLRPKQKFEARKPYVELKKNLPFNRKKQAKH
jgi:hypothetical protein